MYIMSNSSKLSLCILLYVQHLLYVTGIVTVMLQCLLYAEPPLSPLLHNTPQLWPGSIKLSLHLGPHAVITLRHGDGNITAHPHGPLVRLVQFEVKPSDEPRDHQRQLGPRELHAEAHACTLAEGHEVAVGHFVGAEPAVGVERARVRKDVFVVVHQRDGHADGGVGWDVPCAARGEFLGAGVGVAVAIFCGKRDGLCGLGVDYFLVRYSAVARRHAVAEAEALSQTRLEVREGFQGRPVEVGAVLSLFAAGDHGEQFVSEALDYGGVGEDVVAADRCCPAGG